MQKKETFLINFNIVQACKQCSLISSSSSFLAKGRMRGTVLSTWSPKRWPACLQTAPTAWIIVLVFWWSAGVLVSWDSMARCSSCKRLSISFTYMAWSQVSTKCDSAIIVLRIESKRQSCKITFFGIFNIQFPSTSFSQPSWETWVEGKERPANSNGKEPGVPRT